MRFGTPRRLEREPDVSAEEALRSAGVDGPVLERLLRPFLAGVLGERELATSRRYVDLVLRSFVRGTPAVPAQGMGMIPRQLAERLPPDALRLGQRATSVRELRATHRAVVVATDPVAAAGLLERLPHPRMNALTTFYHLAPDPPTDAKALIIDGLNRGPVVNSVLLSNVAASYARNGHLVSSTVLGTADEATVRRHLATMYAVDTARWELVATYDLPQALPSLRPPTVLRQPVALGDGVFVAGDHRDTPSQQGALVSGRRAADAVLEELHASN